MSMIGKTLAHYEIITPLGRGGMGEVYQAKDRKLGRDVAIKVLPEEFARDTDRVARFQREAKLLASLNHPNIAAIHGLEQFEGTNFLVLELVEGQTLADRIKAGPIPVEESLKLALQIADALEAAHEKGVIHRDLKPANIKVTPEGKVKVLDFGLAKAYAGDREEVNLSNSPTLSDAATQQGVILGTAAYMSPEQARGKSVDKRADIWAFGCVLYEMLTGRVAFRGEDVSEILASVIKADVKLDLLPANLHSRVREVIIRCLQKDLKRRYSSITDARYEIEQVLADPGGVLVEPATTVKPRRKLRVGLSWVAAALFLGLIIAGVAVWKMKPTEPRQVTRFAYDIPEDQQFVMISVPVIAVSPDGRQFVYSTSKGLYLRSVDELTAKLVAGTEGPTLEPFFSPDGKWIAYVSGSDRKLKKIAVNGGAPVVLCDITSFVGGRWNEDNTIVFGQWPGPIMRISANGGAPEAITKIKGETHVLPQILPGGKSLLYTAVAANNQTRVVVQSLKSGETKELFAGGGARYLPTGHIVYGLPNNNNLFAIPFDLGRLEVKGGAVPIVEGILQYAVSDAGTLVYLPGTAGASSSDGRTLVWVDRNGKEEPLGAPPDQYLFPKISPDGTRVAMAIMGENEDIWVWDLARKTMTRLTFDKSRDQQPIWTPDSKEVLFWSEREGKFGGIFRKQADGTGEDQKLVAAPDRQLFPWSISSDGKALLVLDTPDANAKGDISMLSMEGDHARKPLLHQDGYVTVQPKISPDGRWMAYVSNESGKSEVYVRPFPEVNKGRWQVSTKGGVSPLWAPNGRELFYFGEDDGSVTSVAVETAPVFKPATPGKLFSRNPYLGGGSTPGTPWDIHPDGKRFLMMKLPGAAPSAAGGPRKISIVLNWFEELKQRAPVK
jgi:serine/threonine protein kinase/Tol biopolymer transport system component